MNCRRKKEKYADGSEKRSEYIESDYCSQLLGLESVLSDLVCQEKGLHSPTVEAPTIV